MTSGPNDSGDAGETRQNEAAALRATWARLGIPGVIDVHTHFMPERVMDKVWDYFDQVGPLTGRAWPIATATTRTPASTG